MKRIMSCVICAAALCCTGCSAAQQSGESAAELTVNGMIVETSEDFDEAYQTLITDYFQAIENKDFEAYQAVMYPPYKESFEKYLKENGSTLADSFQDVCHRFDEDGYESWTLTKLELSYYPEDKVDLDGFFNAYANAGIFDENFAEETRKDTEEIRDVQFSLYALYAGDEEPVQIIGGNEMMVMKNADGAYLIG